MRTPPRFARALVASAAWVGWLVGACQVKVDPQHDAASASDRRAQPDAADRSSVDTAEPHRVERKRPTLGPEEDPLGERFADPSWFRRDMLEGAEVVTMSRSVADENGFFMSHIVFELPEGTTAEQCADKVSEKIAPSVTDLSRAMEGDRIKISGSTDRYRVLSMCGEAEGVMRAYVSFEWFA